MRLPQQCSAVTPRYLVDRYNVSEKPAVQTTN